MDKINKALGLDLNFPRVPNESGFLIDFADDGQPTPRFLGVSNSKNDYNILEQSIPIVDSQVGGTGLTIEDRHEPSAAYRKKMELAVNEHKNKGKAKTQKAQQQKQKKNKNGKAAVLPSCTSSY